MNDTCDFCEYLVEHEGGRPGLMITHGYCFCIQNALSLELY